LKRAEFRARQFGLDPERLVFLDETWVKTNMTRTRGRAPCGQRLIEQVPYGRWKTTTFVAGLTTRGIIAPLVIDGPINGELFVAYLRQQLIPAMRAGDTLVLDNLSAHKSVAVANALQEAGMQVLYLPPYSPEWNPIELTFNVFKGRMRAAKERTVEGLHQRCGEESAKFTPQQCRNFILKCGYRYS
jgi:transposase